MLIQSRTVYHLQWLLVQLGSVKQLLSLLVLGFEKILLVELDLQVLREVPFLAKRHLDGRVIALTPHGQDCRQVWVFPLTLHRVLERVTTALDYRGNL